MTDKKQAEQQQNAYEQWRRDRIQGAADPDTGEAVTTNEAGDVVPKDTKK